MFDYYSVIASAVSRLPSNNDKVRHAIYEQAHTALHERLRNDPQISDDELVNEHYMLEAAIYGRRQVCPARRLLTWINAPIVIVLLGLRAAPQ